MVPLVVSRRLLHLRLQPTDDCAKDLLASSRTASARRLCPKQVPCFARKMPWFKHNIHNKLKADDFCRLLLIGRSEVTRTPGILLPKQARYQLRYAPI